MTSSQKMYKLATKLYFKHLIKNASNAEEHREEILEGLHTALANASSQNLGIMPFIKMIAQDGIILSFDLTRNDYFGGIRKIIVDNIIVKPLEKEYLQPKYAILKDQIENYLSKNWRVFPGSGEGEHIKYNNFTIHLIYKLRSK